MSKKLLFIVIGGVLVVLVAGMGTGFYLLLNKISSLHPVPKTMNKEGAGSEKDAAAMGPKYPLETLIANLSDPGGNRYLRVTMEFELSTPGLEEELKLRNSQIKDSLLMTISTMGLREINTVEGKNGLRTRIMERLNGFLKGGAITSVFFTEFVIQ